MSDQQKQTEKKPENEKEEKKEQPKQPRRFPIPPNRLGGIRLA